MYIKIIVSDKLTELPLEEGVFDSFIGSTHPQRGCRFFALHRHYLRFAKNAPFISYELFILNLSNACKEFNKTFNSKTTPIVLRFRVWTDLKLKFVIEACPFHSRYPSGAKANLLSVPYVRNRTGKYTPAKESLNSFHQAKAKQCDEGLFVDKLDLITEASWSNFFWIDKGQNICRSGLGLQGVAQSLLHKLANTTIHPIHISDLLSQKPACFISNAVHGIVPVASVNEIPMQESILIDNLKQCYNNYIQSDNEVTWIPINF